MKPFKRHTLPMSWQSFVPILAVIAEAMLLPAHAPAQTTNVSEMRELRVACLESFNSAKARLDELHGFVGQQAECERTASDRLFELQQSAASAKRRNLDLQEESRRCTSRLALARKAVEQAATSYRAAVASMPGGEDWARDGSTALGELRRAADATPQDTWKYKRCKELQAEFVDTLQQWRAARRSMERASFDLEMRASSDAFERTATQIEAASKELKTLEGQLTNRKTALDKLSKQSEQWGATIRTLRDAEATSRNHLAAIGFKFHLVDLQFAAWRMKYSDVGDEGVEVLPDVLELSLESETAKGPGYLTPLPGAAPATDSAAYSNAMEGEPRQEEEKVERADPTFQKILARVLLAQARLRVLSNVLDREFNSVQAAIGSLEKTEEHARELADNTARLAADQESLRRSQETEQQTLTKGTETLDLVKKRFADDHKAIGQLLDTAAERTATLAKRLERQI